MRHRSAIKSLLCAALLCPAAGCTVYDVDRQTMVHNDGAGDSASPLEYIVYLPPGYGEPDAADRQWPVVFTLHGLLEATHNLNILEKYGPAEQIENGRDFPFISITPQTRESRSEERCRLPLAINSSSRPASSPAASPRLQTLIEATENAA